MKVRILTNDFVIGHIRYPKGSIVELPPVAVDYLVLQKRGERVEEGSPVKEPYQRQDMRPEEISPSPEKSTMVPSDGEIVERPPPVRKKRSYQRRVKKEDS